MKLGYKLFELREKSKLSQQEIAEKLNIQQSTYNKWENNKTVPSSEYLPQLAQLFGVDISELFSNDGTNIYISDSTASWNNSTINSDVIVEKLIKQLEEKDKTIQQLLEQNKELVEILKNKK
jgi:transcriptional regulator with XRE-family HTH domain